MHILIGGGSGHIGKLLTSYLKQRGHRVTWISRYPGQDRITWQQLRWDEAPKDVEGTDMHFRKVQNWPWQPVYEKNRLVDRFLFFSSTSRQVSLDRLCSEPNFRQKNRTVLKDRKQVL
jgi:hypothetical protein